MSSHESGSSITFEKLKMHPLSKYAAGGLRKKDSYNNFKTHVRVQCATRAQLLPTRMAAYKAA